VSPLRGEKPQNRPLSKRNTGRFALRAMLPVIIFCINYSAFVTVDAGTASGTFSRYRQIL